MSLRFLSLMLLLAASGWAEAPRKLRFCVDPNNMPLSSDSAPGIENQVARIVA